MEVADDRGMAVRPELLLRLPNSPGALASVLSALDTERIRVDAMSLERGGSARLIVDNPDLARSILTKRHLQVEIREAIVVMVSSRSVGTLLSSVAANGINVEYAYVSSPAPDGLVALVLGVDDAMRAAAKTGL
jgi:hypothetical protein